MWLCAKTIRKVVPEGYWHWCIAKSHVRIILMVQVNKQEEMVLMVFNRYCIFFSDFVITPLKPQD